MGRACSTYRENIYRVFVGKPERKRPIERLRLRWEDDNKIDHR
jgi:hypothetical protein